MVLGPGNETCSHGAVPADPPGLTPSTLGEREEPEIDVASAAPDRLSFRCGRRCGTLLNVTAPSSLAEEAVAVARKPLHGWDPHTGPVFEVNPGDFDWRQGPGILSSLYLFL